MNEHTKQATEFAFSDNVAEMKSEIEASLHYKIANAIEAEKIEIAKTLMTVGVSEEKECCDHEGKPKGNQNKLDVAEPKGKLTAADFKKLRKEGEEAEDSIGMKQLKQNEKDKQEWIKNNPLMKGRNPVEQQAAWAIHSALNKYHNKNVTEDVEQVDEKLTSDMPASKIIHDFVHSDNPKFQGKSKKDKIKMALGAFYGMHPSKSKNEEVELTESNPEDVISDFNDRQSYLGHKKMERSHIKQYKATSSPIKQSHHQNMIDQHSSAANEILDKYRKESVEQIEEAKPSEGLSAKKKSMIVKKAKKGEDIGKSGKGFEKVEAAAEKGGARDPKAVAAAAMWKKIKR